MRATTALRPLDSAQVDRIPQRSPSRPLDASAPDEYDGNRPSRQEDAMAKGQMRSNKEKKKPKAEHNKKKKGSAPSPFAAVRNPVQSTFNPQAKKGA
jgi:hypothetical protein